MMTHILMSRFRESTGRRKTSFLKETVENADLHKAVLSKTMTPQELCVIDTNRKKMISFPRYANLTWAVENCQIWLKL